MTVNIQLFDDLEAVALDAAGALDRAAQPSLFSRLNWFRLIHDHCPPAGKLVALRARDGDRTAWLFAAADGRTARAYAAWYSLRFDAVGDRQADVMTSLAATLRDGGITRVELAPIADPEPLRKAFTAAGWRVFLTEKTGNWRIATAGMDFETIGPAGRRSSEHGETARQDGRLESRYTTGSTTGLGGLRSRLPGELEAEEGSVPFLRARRAEGAAGTLRLGSPARTAGHVAVHPGWSKMTRP